MIRYLLVNLMLALMLAACATEAQPTEQGLLPNEDSHSSDSSENWTPAQQAAITALSQTIDLPADQITLISTETVDWPDGCLGVKKIGVMCTEAIVPGYRIILEANGEQYEFHTDQDGSQVVQVDGIVAAGSVEEMVVKQLASNLELSESDISVVGSSDIKFPDACLGVAMQNVECAQVEISGKIIILEADDVQYEYHVSADGTRVQPATLALTWTREGGIAGFCDSLTVFLSGEVFGNQCRSESDGTMDTFANLLSSDEREQFNTWINGFGQVNLDASDPKGVSDRMEVTLVFYGNGKGALVKSDEQKLFLWAQDLFQKLYSSGVR